jgi:hypothetical protein
MLVSDAVDRQLPRDSRRSRLQEAIVLGLEANRTLAEDSLRGGEVIKELLPID